jgi:hypothetical protein
MATPNWTTLPILSSQTYLDLVDSDTNRDVALTLLGQQVTDDMINYLDNSNIDPANPPLTLQRACAEQVCYEWKQRRFSGLQSVQMQDGQIHKYQTGAFLEDVEKKLKRFKSFALYETNLS